MIYLLLSVICSAGIFISFKIAQRRGISIPGVITINYYTAVILGGFLGTDSGVFQANAFLAPGFFLSAALLGFLFVVMFLVANKSIQQVGAGLSAAASKLSVVFPFFYSIAIDPADVLDTRKILTIALVVVAVLLISLRKGAVSRLPAIGIYTILLFVGMGLVDSLIKFAQFHFVPDQLEAGFSLLVFTMAAITASVWYFSKKADGRLFRAQTILAGLGLGLSNYGSLFFFVKALNAARSGSILDSSMVFATNNVLIIVLTASVGLLFFGERLTRVNKAGLILSLVAIVLLYIIK